MFAVRKGMQCVNNLVKRWSIFGNGCGFFFHKAAWTYFSLHVYIYMTLDIPNTFERESHSGIKKKHMQILSIFYECASLEVVAATAECVLNIVNIHSANSFAFTLTCVCAFLCYSFFFLHILNSKYNLNIVWSQGNFYGHFLLLCWFMSLQHSLKFCSIIFIFDDILQRIKALCNVSTLILIKVIRV